MFGKRRFEVGSLVPVDHILLGKSVDHGYDTWEHLLSFLLALQRLQFLDRVSGGLVLILVPQMLGLIASDSLQGRFVICHSFIT